MLKICLTSDTHLGSEATSEEQLHLLFENMHAENPDVIIHAGDYNGGSYGSAAVKRTIEILREHSNLPVVSVLGNHDYWSGHYPCLSSHLSNISRIKAIFSDNNVHFLDTDGPLLIKDVAVYGHTLWYKHHSPPTNDLNHMPMHLEGDTHSCFYRTHMREAENQLNTQVEARAKIWVSHFPVHGIRTITDKQFSGCDRFGEHLLSLGFFILINGHSHRRRPGPVQYECGSDYGQPRYSVIDI